LVYATHSVQELISVSFWRMAGGGLPIITHHWIQLSWTAEPSVWKRQQGDMWNGL